MSESVYKAVLLDHFRNPRNKGDLTAMSAVARGSNPRCGDDVEVGVCTAEDGTTQVRFRGRGCSICLASASMMSECVSGLALDDASELLTKTRQWFDDKNNTAAPHENIAALDVVRQHPARKKCVSLAWNALQQALSDFSQCKAK